MELPYFKEFSVLSEIAPIADVLAAIGVIASLILVYLELRRGNKEARMAHWYKNMEAFRDFYALTDDPEIAKIVIKGRSDMEQLNNVEYMIFDSYNRRCVLAFNHFRRNTGQVLEQKNEALTVLNSNLRREMNYPGVRAWWDKNRVTKPFAQSTVDWVDRTLS